MSKAPIKFGIMLHGAGGNMNSWKRPSGGPADASVNPEFDYQLGFPAVVNHAVETERIAQIAREAFGEAWIATDFRPRTASEDFAFYLERRQGSFVFVGNGDGPTLHSPHYNFNDQIIAPAATL